MSPSDVAEQFVVEAITQRTAERGIPIEVIDLRPAPAERLNAVTARLCGFGACDEDPDTMPTLLMLQGFDVFGDAGTDAPTYPFRSQFQFDKKFLWLFMGRDPDRMRWLFGSYSRPLYHAAGEIGTEFETSTGQRWRCTDVGQRSIVAIELQPELEEAWFRGPPYAVPEVVFDEKDIAAAFRHYEDAVKSALAEVDRGLHPGYPNEVVKTMTEAWFPDECRRYLHQRLFRIDRVDDTGEVLHPYAAEQTANGWCILLYAPFTQTFSSMPEGDFVRLRQASPQDFVVRKSRGARILG